MRFKRLLVTGGAGFIGSAFIRYGLENLLVEKIVNLDLLTYAGHGKKYGDLSLRLPPSFCARRHLR
jgi:dTDP-glucose 4,6-dehydratase